MQEFKHVNAKTFEEASRELADGCKVDNLAMAGGTDLMTELRTRIQPVYPDKIVNLKSIEGAEYIEGDETVKIGALTKLKDVEASGKLPAVLREAAHSVASPLVRNKATIGVIICQDQQIKVRLEGQDDFFTPELPADDVAPIRQWVEGILYGREIPFDLQAARDLTELMENAYIADATGHEVAFK